MNNVIRTFAAAAAVTLIAACNGRDDQTFEDTAPATAPAPAPEPIAPPPPPVTPYDTLGQDTLPGTGTGTGTVPPAGTGTGGDR